MMQPAGHTTRSFGTSPAPAIHASLRVVARSRSFGARLGARIRARRNAKGWSQATLAETVGVGANYVGVLERGAKLPTIETLVAVAAALGCSPAVLLDDGAATADPWMAEIVTVAATVPKPRRELVLAVMKAMTSPGSG